MTNDNNDTGLFARLHDWLTADPLPEPGDPIGDDQMPREIHIPVDNMETIRLEYRGEWYEVIKTDSGLEIIREADDD